MSDPYRIDSTKIHFHPRHVAQVMEADTWEKAKTIYPLYWEITTSAACNHRCTFCSVDAIGYPAILMDENILCRRMDEAQRLGVKSVMFGGTGEPLLHKGINSITRWAVVGGLDAAFTTNGVLLNKLYELPMCSWVKVSLNAGIRESYAAIHKTDEKDWDIVWKNIRDAVKRKGDCALGVQCVVLPENYMDMFNLALLCAAAGVDYLVLKPYSQATFSIVQRPDIDYRTMQDELQAVVDNFKGFDVILRTNAITNEITGKHNFEKCRATPLTWVYSMANGDVFTCSAHLLDQKFCIGNLNKQSFQEIWEGDKRRKNWEMMREFDIHNCRLSCRMAQVNTYLEQLDHGVPHVNFP